MLWHGDPWQSAGQPVGPWVLRCPCGNFQWIPAPRKECRQLKHRAESDKSQMTNQTKRGPNGLKVLDKICLANIAERERWNLSSHFSPPAIPAHFSRKKWSIMLSGVLALSSDFGAHQAGCLHDRTSHSVSPHLGPNMKGKRLEREPARELCLQTKVTLNGPLSDAGERPHRIPERKYKPICVSFNAHLNLHEPFNSLVSPKLGLSPPEHEVWSEHVNTSLDSFGSFPWSKWEEATLKEHKSYDLCVPPPSIHVDQTQPECCAAQFGN